MNTNNLVLIRVAPYLKPLTEKMSYLCVRFYNAITQLRHTVVSHVAKKADTLYHGYINRKK